MRIRGSRPINQHKIRLAERACLHALEAVEGVAFDLDALFNVVPLDKWERKIVCVCVC